VNISGKSRARLYLACTWIEAVVVVAVGRLKRALGMRYQPTSWDRFARLFLLHQLGRQPRLTITCAERTDGAGAQAHTMISAMNFARAFDHEYTHTPFSEIDHADRPMAQWVEAWEKLFNLGEGEQHLDPGHTKAVNYSEFHPRLYHAVCKILENCRVRPVPGAEGSHEAEPHFQPFFYHSDLEPDSYEALIPDLRRKFQPGRPRAENRFITVAVHMRRGDVTPAHPQRFTPVETVCETTRLVKSLLEDCGQQYRVCLYSQGAVGDFACLEALGAQLCLDVDPVWTMRQLVEADILVMSKSSFSYVAALISDGIKLYEPFWHSPLGSWIARDSAGGFDLPAFECQLQLLTQQRRHRTARAQ
jgi:hypothetical protein